MKNKNMISYLSGTIRYKSLHYVILLTGGVGYKVTVPTYILSESERDASIELFIYTYVKEDALDLYGFKTPEDLALFELFLTVSGIGPKTAMSIFSASSPEKIKGAILRGTVSFFTSIPRIGTKNAQKIIIELRSKLGSLETLNLTPETQESKEIMDALKSFGYHPHEMKDVVSHVTQMDGTVSDKIRAALKAMGKK